MKLTLCLYRSAAAAQDAFMAEYSDEGHHIFERLLIEVPGRAIQYAMLPMDAKDLIPYYGCEFEAVHYVGCTPSHEVRVFFATRTNRYASP